jgi:hypothetical protein
MLGLGDIVIPGKHIWWAVYSFYTILMN